jgi:hypothetical protein
MQKFKIIQVEQKNSTTAFKGARQNQFQFTNILVNGIEILHWQEGYCILRIFMFGTSELIDLKCSRQKIAFFNKRIPFDFAPRWFGHVYM